MSGITMLPLAKLPGPPPVFVTVVTLGPKGVLKGVVAIGGKRRDQHERAGAIEEEPQLDSRRERPRAELLVVVILAVPVNVAASGGGGGAFAMQSAS